MEEGWKAQGRGGGHTKHCQYGTGKVNELGGTKWRATMWMEITKEKECMHPFVSSID